MVYTLIWGGASEILCTGLTNLPSTWQENLKVAVASHEERYEEVNNELRLKVVQVQTLEAEMERRGKDVAARDAEIQRLQVRGEARVEDIGLEVHVYTRLGHVCLPLCKLRQQDLTGELGLRPLCDRLELDFLLWDCSCYCNTVLSSCRLYKNSLV